MLGICLIVFGIFIISDSFVLYSFLIEFGRGMNTTGCHQYCSIRWDDFIRSDSLIFYVPAGVGLIIMVIGLIVYNRQRKTKKQKDL